MSLLVRPAPLSFTESGSAEISALGSCCPASSSCDYCGRVIGKLDHIVFLSLRFCNVSCCDRWQARFEVRGAPVSVGQVGGYAAGGALFFGCILWDSLAGMIGEDQALLYLGALGAMVILGAMAVWWAAGTVVNGSTKRSTR